MSCLGNNYLPVPPRVWNRVQNSCTLEPLNTVPSTDVYINYLKDNENANMLAKGNVLQHKNNSSNLTKKQQYAKMARGQWTTRHITWATQSQTVSNPNSKMLKRNGAVNVLVDPFTGAVTETTLPLTCPNNLNDGQLVIQDGGTLQCDAQQNSCTGKIVIQPSRQRVFPTSDSDVPGTIRPLYWKDGTQTWYPKPRRVMNNSTDGWPIGAKHIQTAQM